MHHSSQSSEVPKRKRPGRPPKNPAAANSKKELEKQQQKQSEAAKRYAMRDFDQKYPSTDTMPNSVRIIQMLRIDVLQIVNATLQQLTPENPLQQNQ